MPTAQPLYQYSCGRSPFRYNDLYMRDTPDVFLDRARHLHQKAVVIDTHCDTTQRLLHPTWDIQQRHTQGHVDVPRLQEGGIDAVFFAVWRKSPMLPGAGIDASREQIARIKEVTNKPTSSLQLARTTQDVRRAKQSGKIAVLLAIEGGDLIEESIETLREYAREGATYLTLTHATHTALGDSSGVHESLQPKHGGLSPFGREVVLELNRLGMMVDVSHVSDKTFWDVLDVSQAPVLATHSCCRALFDHRRNLSDDMIRALADQGGSVQINFAAGFLDPDFPELDPEEVRKWFNSVGHSKRPLCDHRTPFHLLVDHIDHALQLVGPDHVGIGSDFDGVPALPEGMENCSKLPYLTAELMRRGYSDEDLTKVLGENVLRIMTACRNFAEPK